MQLFYNPNIDIEFIGVGSILELPSEEALHAIRVLRNKPGDIIWLTDGKGNMLRGKISEISKRDCSVEIEEINSNYGTRSVYIHAAVAPTKNISRFEWFLEKATEMGVDEITPLICAHSERRNVNIERLEKVITSAVKQSLKAWHPTLNPPEDFKKFVKTNRESELFMAHLTHEEQPLLKDTAKSKKHITVIIGPEGDFSPEEITLSQEEGYKLISLGPERLRTETAALASVFTINLINL